MSDSHGTRHAQNQKMISLKRKLSIGTHTAAAAAADPNSQHQHSSILQSAQICCSLTETGTVNTQAPHEPICSYPLSLLDFLPEAGRRVHRNAAAGRRGGFPLLSVRHAAARSCLQRLSWLEIRPERPGRHLRGAAAKLLRWCLRRLWEKWPLLVAVVGLFNYLIIIEKYMMGHMF